MLIESFLPHSEQLVPGVDPASHRRNPVMARVAEEGFEPEAPPTVAALAEIADPDKEYACPTPLVAPSFREALLPVAEHAGAI
jgi:hypothetical protein